MWYVYCIENRSHNYLYIGSTNNLSRRLQQHNEGKSLSTKPYRPFELTAYVAVSTRRKARNLERYLKTGSGKTILKKRILQDWS